MSHKLFTWNHRVYFGDTDAAQVAYHAQYIRWFEAARIEFLEAIGCSYVELQDQHIGFVPKKYDIDYRRPLKFGDYFKATIQVKLIKKSYIVLEQIIYKDDEICCYSTLQLVCMNEKTWSIRAIPDWISSKMAPYSPPKKS